MQNIETALKLKQKLVNFIYDAEGEIAVALENYAAEKGKKNSYGIKQQNLAVDLFISQGKINDRTPLEIFEQQHSDLDSQERELLKLWHRNFIGLFEIKAITDNRYELMNWLTAKTYSVYSHSAMPAKETSKWQPGEILLTIIAPIDQQEWFFFGDRVVKGKLSQPKLAVAVGEFRDNYPEFLYADAPELLKQAWDSVIIYHQEFVDYMGSDSVTMSGYELKKKIGELQQRMSSQRLAEAGIDDSQSFSEMIAQSGASEEEFTETATNLGADAEAIAKVIKNKDKLSMVTPKVDLPPEIKQAESVTVISHPQWGQMFLPNYHNFISLLESAAPEDNDDSNLFIRKYLEKPEANYYIWQQLKQQHPQALTTLLQKYTDTDFDLATDLDSLLLQHNKTETPELPAMASVPLHLNDLFETAVAQVQKTKSKSKKKAKKKGFFKL